MKKIERVPLLRAGCKLKLVVDNNKIIRAEASTASLTRTSCA